MPTNNQIARPLAPNGTGAGTGPGLDSTDAATEGPGLTFLVTTDPRQAKSAATRKRVRQAAALKSWRDIKGETAASAALKPSAASASGSGPAPRRSKIARGTGTSPGTGTGTGTGTGAGRSRKRARRKASAATQSITWEGLPASQHQHQHQQQQQQQQQHQGAVFLPARPPIIAAASASASSSSSTYTLSSLSSTSIPSPFIHPQAHEFQNDTPLDTIVLPADSSLSLQRPFLPSSKQNRAQAAPLLSSSSESSLVTTPAAATDDALRVSFRHTIGWPANAAGQISTSPKLPSISEIIRHQVDCSRRSGFGENVSQAQDEASAADDLPSPCHAYCNELDPFNCCPVKHKSWFDGVLHHMLTVFAPRAWPTLRITNEQGLRWEHFMTQHAFSEPALYYVRLLFATGDMVALNVAEPQLRLWLQSRAIESINDALADPSRATSDALILAIGRIALNESLYGDKLAAHTLHRPAQQRMIALRGGIDALGFPPLVKRLMRWSDKVMSMQGGTPRMIPDDAEPHYTDATCVEVLEKWSPSEGMALRKKSLLQAAE